MSDFDNIREDRYSDQLEKQEAKFNASFNHLFDEFMSACKKRDSTTSAYFAPKVRGKFQTVGDLFIDSLDYPACSRSNPVTTEQLVQLVLDVAYSGENQTQAAQDLITRMANVHAYYYASEEWKWTTLKSYQ